MVSELQKMEVRLRRELLRPLPRVGFDPELLERYRNDLKRDRKLARIFYYLAVVAVFGLAPLYGPSLLQTPAAVVPLYRPLEFGVILPLCVIAAAIDFLPLSRRVSAAVHLGVMLALWGALLVMQRAARAENFYFPPEVLGIAVLCAAMLCGFTLKYMLRGIVLFTALNVLNEWFSNSPAQVFFMDALLILVLGLAAGAGAFFMEVLQRRLWLAGELSKLTARTDSLTALATRAEFNHRFADVLAMAGRQRRPVAVMLMDVDNFKSVNDGYGHIYGDEVLRRLGAIMLDMARRPLDIQARYGGEELVIVWYDCDEAAAQKLAEEVLATVRGAQMPAPPLGAPPRVTVSAGVVVLVPESATRPADVLRTADDLMYQAKRAGKDRVLFRGRLLGAPLSAAMAGG
ncbi:MAG: GGDEF domain-containing protein [Nevskia sp.]|nr:GGDEF domain-containing protein [Nevskia sp.]